MPHAQTRQNLHHALNWSVPHLAPMVICMVLDFVLTFTLFILWCHQLPRAARRAFVWVFYRHGAGFPSCDPIHFLWHIVEICSVKFDQSSMDAAYAHLTVLTFIIYKLSITKAASCSASSIRLMSSWLWAMVMSRTALLYPVIATVTMTNSYSQKMYSVHWIYIPDWFTWAFSAIPDVSVCDIEITCFKGFLHSALFQILLVLLIKILYTNLLLWFCSSVCLAWLL